MRRIVIILILQFLLVHGLNEWKKNVAFNVEATGHYVFRVVNGQPATYGDVPWQVGFMARVKTRLYMAFCGGSIVQPRLIVSAAHCFVEDFQLSPCAKGRLSKQNLKRYVAVGGHMPSHGFRPHPDSKSGQWRYLERGKYPRNFKFPKNDIALLTTQRPFNFNDFVHPIPLASQTKDYGGVTCLASGYGRINDRDQSDKLLIAHVEVITIRQCSRIHMMNMSKFVCTSDLVSDIHKGDSGGPLVCKGVDPEDKGEGVLVGVTSGKALNKRDGSFFTRVSIYRKFLTSQGVCVQKLAYNEAFLIYVIIITFELINYQSSFL